MIGKPTIRLKKTDSTNLYLQQVLKNSKLQEGTAVISEEQTAGRGQKENRWESNKGENITVSFLIYPEFIEVHRQFLLSKFISLAIFDLLNEFVDNVKIKWPNDIYVADKKIAGVLIENTIIGSVISTTIIGIGLNINQKKFSIDLPTATSLSIRTGDQYDLETLLEQLFDKLNARFNELKLGDYKKIDTEYLAALYQYNEFHNYQAGDEIFSAKIVDIENDGRLCLQTQKNELLRFAFKEVHFL